jgi:shikimate dehydrogenase|tara:strand:- start:349 stop:1182 length:834 start_codon:yes stop_codon:yes gene_type:complete
MKKYLVIGNPIEHSLSPLIHNYWMKKHCLFDSIYEKRKVEEKDLKNIIKEIRDEKIIGMNVTIPFKKTIIPFLDELHIYAEDTQSVNTVKKVKNKIIGYNTDRLGFGKTIDDFYSQGGLVLEPINQILDGKNIFILGAGGVTSSIISTLEQKGGNLIISNRTKSKAEELKILFPKIEILDWGKKPKSFDIVINTTSIGLTNNEKINIDFNDCYGDKNKLFYDLIYNPKETKFLEEARLRGNKTMNGQKMFLNQAIHAFNLWTNITPEIDDEVIKFLG